MAAKFLPPASLDALLDVAPPTVDRHVLARLGAALAALLVETSAKAPATSSDLASAATPDAALTPLAAGADAAAPIAAPGTEPSPDIAVPGTTPDAAAPQSVPSPSPSPADNAAAAEDADETDVAPNPRLEQDAWGNPVLWYRLPDPAHLTRAAALLADNGARLCTVTARNINVYSSPIFTLLYHFDVAGCSLTVSVELDSTDPIVPTLTPWFRNADWNEREFAELYAVRLSGRPAPERLFLDPDIDAGIMNEAIPLSIMMNGACTTDMWEHLLRINAREKDRTRGEGAQA